MGLGQTLPSTGAQLAQKLGVQWRPDLMTAKTDEGAAYQTQMANAYLQEGIQKTGNVRDALKYYHGGPDRAQWGPKTNAYAENVLALAGNPQAMPQSYAQMPRPQDMLNLNWRNPGPEIFDEQPGVLNQSSIADLI